MLSRKVIVVEGEAFELLLGANDLEDQLYASIVAPEALHLIELQTLQRRKVGLDCLEDISGFLDIVCEILKIELLQFVLLSGNPVNKIKHSLSGFVRQIIGAP